MSSLISATRFSLVAESKRVSEMEDAADQRTALFAKFVVHEMAIQSMMSKR